MKNTIRVLIIQFRKDKNKIKSEQESFDNVLKNIDHRFVSIFDKRTKLFSNTKKTLKKYSHIILGGSSEFGLSEETIHPKERKYIIKRVKKLLDEAWEKDHHILGICFGHHLLAYNFGAEIIRSDKQRELGKINVSYSINGRKDKLFTGFKDHFPALTAHIESVAKKIHKMSILASSQKCKIASFKIKNNIYGVQFHPELDKRSFLKRLSLGNKDGDDYKNVFKVGKTDTKKIIRNFLTF